jgi:hypothetical protein
MRHTFGAVAGTTPGVETVGQAGGLDADLTRLGLSSIDINGGPARSRCGCRG